MVRPQNNRCPAGGTIKGRARARTSPTNLESTRGIRRMRGVIVAPPSGNTASKGEGPNL
jgi:hypothetical protein